MSIIHQIRQENEQALAEKLPEKATIDLLEHKTDMVMYIGLMKMQEIITNDDYETASGKKVDIGPDDKIKAFNATIHLGKLVDKRMERKKAKNHRPPEIPKDLEIT